MRILIVSQYYYPEVFPSTLIAEELVKRGHVVDVVTGKPNYGLNPIPREYDHIDREDVNGVHIRRLPLHKRKKGPISLVWNYLSFWHSVKRFFKKFDETYDVIYGFNFSPIVSLDGAGDFAKRTKTPYVIHVYDLWPESVVATKMMKRDSLLYRKLFAISKRIYSESDCLLLSSPAFAKYFQNVIRIDKPSHTVYQPMQEEGSELVPSPFEESEKPLVYCGNLGRLQDLKPVILAMNELKGEKGLALYVIGEGDEKKSLEGLASSLGLLDRVHFLGHLKPDEALPYRKHAFMNVVALKGDGSYVSNTIPTKLITALKDGRPILGMVSGDGAKVLKEAGGAFVTNMDAQDVQRNIENVLVLSKEERDEMGEKNLSFYWKNFRTEKVVDSIESVLSTLKK